MSLILCLTSLSHLPSLFPCFLNVSHYLHNLSFSLAISLSLLSQCLAFYLISLFRPLNLCFLAFSFAILYLISLSHNCSLSFLAFKMSFILCLISLSHLQSLFPCFLNSLIVCLISLSHLQSLFPCFFNVSQSLPLSLSHLQSLLPSRCLSLFTSSLCR